MSETITPTALAAAVLAILSSADLKAADAATLALSMLSEADLQAADDAALRSLAYLCDRTTEAALRVLTDREADHA